MDSQAGSGPSAQVAGPQIARMYTMIVGTDPRQLQFEFALWTQEMVREVIRRKFEVHLSAAVSVGRLLRKMGLSPQRPSWLATRQNPDAVEEFKTVIFPKIWAEAAAKGGTVWFADEAGVRSDCHAGATWAPKCRTPVVKSTGPRHSVNMLSAVAPDGSLRFSTYTARFTSAEFIDFCNRLLDDAAGPVFVVVDGHPAHRSKAAKEFVESTGGRLKLSITCPATRGELCPDGGCEQASTRPSSAGPASPARTTSEPMPSPHSNGCRGCHTSSAGSSATRGAVGPLV
ncbi:MAG: IS630 family transposase [Nitriliruptor sp.]|nr:MAG: IS630 family transposase [Nitriliruptor sp.]